MKTSCCLLFVAFAATTVAFGQSSSELKMTKGTPGEGKGIEGYWQDTARRILFAREAPPDYAYGTWSPLDQDQTYPAAKEIRRSGSTYELVDLLYDDEHVIKVIDAGKDGIRFVRYTESLACGMHHNCRLEGDELFCSLANYCRRDGLSVLEWRGEERYARRTLCERDGRRQLLGIPVVCR